LPGAETGARIVIINGNSRSDPGITVRVRALP